MRRAAGCAVAERAAHTRVDVSNATSPRRCMKTVPPPGFSWAECTSF